MARWPAVDRGTERRAALLGGAFAEALQRLIGWAPYSAVDSSPAFAAVGECLFWLVALDELAEHVDPAWRGDSSEVKEQLRAFAAPATPSPMVTQSWRPPPGSLAQNSVGWFSGSHDRALCRFSAGKTPKRSAGKPQGRSCSRSTATTSPDGPSCRCWKQHSMRAIARCHARPSPGGDLARLISDGRPPLE